MDGDYDCVIAGASLAGLNAAYHAAKAGAKVLCVDVKNDVCEFKCAEGILGDHLAELDIRPRTDWVSVEFRRIHLVPPSGSAVDITLKHKVGYILDRAEFQRWLYNRATKAGATIALGLEFKVTGFDLKTGVLKTAGGVPIASKLFIDATGMQSWLGRTVFKGLEKLGDEEFSPVLQDTIKTDRLREYDDCIAMWFGKAHWAPRGYQWVFPKGDGTYNVGLGGIHAAYKKQNLRSLLDKFIARRLGLTRSDYTKLYTIGSRLPLTPPLKEHVAKVNGNVLMLVGDAAHLCWPNTGGGIAVALMSGEQAGRAWMASHKYQRWMNERLVTKQAKANRFKEMYIKDDASIDRAFRKLRWFKRLHTIFPKYVEERAFADIRI